MLLEALSTGHKIGLGLVGLAFVLFAIVSAFVIPSFRPDYPGRRGLPAFLTLTVALFVGMMFSVFFFGREPSEGKAAEGGSSTEATTTAESTSTQATTSQTTTKNTTTQKTTTTTASVPTTAPTAPTQVGVSETEFKIKVSGSSFKAGRYEFDLKNDGQIQHDLVVDGPGVSDEKTPIINAGQSAKLSVELKKGTYELYCSVPGHKQAGMDTKITVS